LEDINKVDTKIGLVHTWTYTIFIEKKTSKNVNSPTFSVDSKHFQSNSQKLMVVGTLVKLIKLIPKINMRLGTRLKYALGSGMNP
jgi:hypothetical protein